MGSYNYFKYTAIWGSLAQDVSLRRLNGWLDFETVFFCWKSFFFFFFISKALKPNKLLLLTSSFNIEEETWNERGSFSKQTRMLMRHTMISSETRPCAVFMSRKYTQVDKKEKPKASCTHPYSNHVYVRMRTTISPG